MNRPNDLHAYWMPFSANRQFKSAPRMLVAADGMYYRSDDGRQILDGTAGLWCVNAGHNRPRIVEAIRQQAGELDYAPGFQMGHPAAFTLANRLVQLSSGAFSNCFFTNSGSESADTAMKMALTYHRVRGEGQRTRFIGRSRGYHGVGFGGLSVGGIGANRKSFGPLLPGVDHLPNTHDLARNAFSRGQPKAGVELADELERIVAIHDPSTIAAVIVEPAACSGGVLIPPVGYLERLRELCDRYGLLLIFDEVITAFGRLGAAFATTALGVVPDMITLAKGLTNGCVPMGAVLSRPSIYDTVVNAGASGQIEFFHGYTYSGHPLACAAALASLDTYLEEGLFERAKTLAPYWESALHALKGRRHIIDLRNLGIIAGIELEPRSGAPTARAFEVFLKCFERGVLIRTSGDIIALSPPLIVQQAEIDRIFSTIAEVLDTVE